MSTTSAPTVPGPEAQPSPAGPSAPAGGSRATLALRRAIADALPERPFGIELWDGSSLPPTQPGGPTFFVRSPLALGHVLRAPSQLGVGRAYVPGALEVDDIDGTPPLLDRWQPPALDTRAKARIAAGAVRAGALRQVPRTPVSELRPEGERHSPERDKRAVRHHYDVSNEFFSL